jgi:hypothetical protein
LFDLRESRKEEENAALKGVMKMKIRELKLNFTSQIG